jgi:Cu-Zn family superoxide dismutase
MNIQKRKITTLIAGILVLAAFGCAPEDIPEGIDSEILEEPGAEIIGALAVLRPTEGNETSGKVNFSITEEGIRIFAELSGLTPGKHGIHIHRLGDCSAADASSAEGHFNPENMPHGAPTDDRRHVGDLGNLIVDDTGTVRYEWTDDVISFTGDHSIIGRSVIVHSGEDDFRTQPTGGAGSRLACGVIGISEETVP